MERTKLEGTDIYTFVYTTPPAMARALSTKAGARSSRHLHPQVVMDVNSLLLGCLNRFMKCMASLNLGEKPHPSSWKLEHHLPCARMAYGAAMAMQLNSLPGKILTGSWHRQMLSKR